MTIKPSPIFYAKPVTAEAFQPYGTLLDPALADPRLNFMVELDNPRANARANLALIRPPIATFPFDVAVMEHHPFSEQVFMPLGDTHYLIIVAHDDGQGRPDLNTVKAFTVTGSLAISYRAETWHTGMVTLGQQGQFAMFIYEDGSPDDCVFSDVAPFQVRVA